MQFSTIVGALLSASVAFASPTPTIEERQAACGTGISPARSQEVVRAFSSAGVTPTLIPSISPKSDLKITYPTVNINLGTQTTTLRKFYGTRSKPPEQLLTKFCRDRSGSSLPIHNTCRRLSIADLLPLPRRPRRPWSQRPTSPRQPAYQLPPLVRLWNQAMRHLRQHCHHLRAPNPSFARRATQIYLVGLP